MSKRHQQLKRRRYCIRQQQCQHIDQNNGRCPEQGIRCSMIDNDGELVEYFCCEHAKGAGYCRNCGNFWAGIDSFDFNQAGLCPNCQAELAADMALEIEGEEEYDAEFYHLQDVAGGVDFE